MFTQLKLIRLADELAADRREALLDRWRQALAGTGAMLQPTLPGAYNGGDWLLRLRAPSRRALDQAEQVLANEPLPAAHVDSAIYEDGSSGGDWNGPGIYRALLLSLRPSAAPAAMARFERELLGMPRHIRSIRAWRLSRVLESSGARPWTHVWEQRYETLEGLNGTYMLHPYHWAWVDRWFDPEHPDWIVDPQLCHSFCALG